MCQNVNDAIGTTRCCACHKSMHICDGLCGAADELCFRNVLATFRNFLHEFEKDNTKHNIFQGLPNFQHEQFFLALAIVPRCNAKCDPAKGGLCAVPRRRLKTRA